MFFLPIVLVLLKVFDGIAISWGITAIFVALYWISYAWFWNLNEAHEEAKSRIGELESSLEFLKRRLETLESTQSNSSHYDDDY